MSSSVQDRLKKLPPYEDDIPMIAEVKKIAEQQNPKEEPEVVEEVKEEEPEVEEKPKKKKEDRTKKQFDKLKEHNKQLKEETEVLRENVLESLRPKQEQTFPPPPPMQEFAPKVEQQVEKLTQNVNPGVVDDIYANLIDENGYIDPELLINSLKQANQVAQRAIKEAEEARKRADEAEKKSERKFRDFEEDKQVRQVHKKYPTLNPKKEDTFNEMFWDDVRKEIATAPILRGENITFMEAADKIYNERYTPKEEVLDVKKKDKEKQEEVDTQKKNINATAVRSQRTDDFSPADQEALVEAVIKNKRGALAERLKRSGY